MLNPLVLKWLIDQIIPQRRTALLLLAVSLIFLGYQGRTALTSLGNYLMLSAAQRMGMTLRIDLLRHLDTLSAEYHDETPLGKVMYPLKEPVDEISYFGSDLVPAILRSALTICFTVATMFTLSVALTWMVLPLVPAFLMVRQRLRRRLVADADIMQEDRAAWSEFMEEHLSSVVPIQLLGQQKRQERRAFQRLARSVRSQQRLFQSGAWFMVGSSLAVGLSMCAVIGYGGVKALAGTLTVGSLVAFYAFVTQLFEPLSSAAELYARAQKAFASIRQVHSAFALRTKVRNAAITISLLRDHPSLIHFDNVEFGYQRQKGMLQVRSLKILPGEQVAIAGENGAGKSTLAKLIARIYDVDRGCISIGGHDVRHIELHDLRRYVCYLPRDPVLFDGTLASNLRFVKPAATDHELEEAARCAGLFAFLATLPHGLHQRIGPQGCQLSGGQRQRLAIARALLQQPQILILDEATSCLDPASEDMVIRDLQQSLGGSTFIVVSHRFSTLSRLNRVVVLSGGSIVEDGNPDSCMAAQGAYARLFASTAPRAKR